MKSESRGGTEKASGREASGSNEKRKIMREVLINRVYRHFKGDCYLTVDIATHSETGEKVVVYRKLYGDGSLWVRPLDLFLSEVDREKYPDCEQRYRFELQEIPSVREKK